MYPWKAIFLFVPDAGNIPEESGPYENEKSRNSVRMPELSKV
jgi:hypothetical protein